MKVSILGDKRLVPKKRADLYTIYNIQYYYYYYYYYYYDIEHTTEGAVCVRVGIWGENDKKLRSSNSI